MFYLEIRPKWPNMPISQVILALPWDSRQFFFVWLFFSLKLMPRGILSPMDTCLAKAKRKSGQIDLMWPDIRPKIRFKEWKDSRICNYDYLLFSGIVTSYYIFSLWLYLCIEQSKYQAKMTLYGQKNVFFILKNHVCRNEEFDNKVFFSRTISPVVCLLNKCIFGFPNQ